MRRVRVVVLCLIGACVASAAVAAGAWATPPEYGRCEKAPKVGKSYTGGIYELGLHQKERNKKGKYEWHPGACQS